MRIFCNCSKLPTAYQCHTSKAQLNVEIHQEIEKVASAGPTFPTVATSITTHDISAASLKYREDVVQFSQPQTVQQVSERQEKQKS